MDTRREARFSAVMGKKALAAGGGFFIGLLVYAVGREVVAAFLAQPTSEVIGDAISAVGSLGWVDTTLVTGFAAVAAATLSIKAVRDQIASDEAVNQRQLDYASKAARDEREARLTGARAVLSVSLSAMCAHAEEILGELLQLYDRCGEHYVPPGQPPQFPQLPMDAVQHLRATIELSGPDDLEIYSALIGKLQVQAARLRTLTREASTLGVSRNTLDSSVLDVAEVYVRASLLFDYARFEAERPTGRVTVSRISTALHGMGVFSNLHEVVCRKAAVYFPLR